MNKPTILPNGYTYLPNISRLNDYQFNRLFTERVKKRFCEVLRLSHGRANNSFALQLSCIDEIDPQTIADIASDIRFCHHVSEYKKIDTMSADDALPAEPIRKVLSPMEQKARHLRLKEAEKKLKQYCAPPEESFLVRKFKEVYADAPDLLEAMLNRIMDRYCRDGEYSSIMEYHGTANFVLCPFVLHPERGSIDVAHADMLNSRDYLILKDMLFHAKAFEVLYEVEKEDLSLLEENCFERAVGVGIRDRSFILGYRENSVYKEWKRFYDYDMDSIANANPNELKGLSMTFAPPVIRGHMESRRHAYKQVVPSVYFLKSIVKQSYCLSIVLEYLEGNYTDANGNSKTDKRIKVSPLFNRAMYEVLEKLGLGLIHTGYKTIGSPATIHKEMSKKIIGLYQKYLKMSKNVTKESARKVLVEVFNEWSSTRARGFYMFIRTDRPLAEAEKIVKIGDKEYKEV